MVSNLETSVLSVSAAFHFIKLFGWSLCA